MTHPQDCYPLDRKYTGKLFIINNLDREQRETRHDVQKIIEKFAGLGFDVSAEPAKNCDERGIKYFMVIFQ